MHPLHIIPYFFGGVLLMNAIPHLVSGLMGRRFPSPFAKPPGKGLSSAPINMLWGFANLLAAYVLVCRIGQFDLRQTGDIAPLAIGMLAIGLQLAWHFGRQNDGIGPRPR